MVMKRDCDTIVLYDKVQQEQRVGLYIFITVVNMEKLVAYMRVPNMRDTLSRAIRYYGPRTDRILRGIYFV